MQILCNFFVVFRVFVSLYFEYDSFGELRAPLHASEMLLMTATGTQLVQQDHLQTLQLMSRGVTTIAASLDRFVLGFFTGNTKEFYYQWN